MLGPLQSDRGHCVSHRPTTPTDWLQPGIRDDAGAGSRAPVGQKVIPPTWLHLQKVKHHQPGNGAHAASLHLPSVALRHAKPPWARDGGEGPQQSRKGMEG